MISTTLRHELSSSFFFLQGKALKKIHATLTETLACVLPGRAKDLSAPLYRRLGGLQGWSGWARKISPPLGFDSQSNQPIAKTLYQLCYKQILKRDNYSTANLAVFNFDAYHTTFSMYDIKVYFKKHILIRPSLMSQDMSSLLDIQYNL